MFYICVGCQIPVLREYSFGFLEKKKGNLEQEFYISGSSQIVNTGEIASFWRYI